MNQRTLFMAWQDTARSRLWFPVARLDADVAKHSYRFRYIRGAERARREAGFPLLMEFPEIARDYRSRQLFPVFQNRVLNRRRPEREQHLRAMDLGPDADPIEILATSGGRRVTDAYEVFPKLAKAPDGSFSCRFFLHGWRHVNHGAQERLEALGAGEKLYVTIELTNPRDRVAVQIQTTDYHVIGWAPRYLVGDLAAAMAEAPSEYFAEVVRVNRADASTLFPVFPSERVLIEMRGTWTHHEPMSGEDYRLVAGGD